MYTLQRASIVLGPREWVATFITQLNAHMYLENAMSKADSDGEEQERKRELEAIAEQIDKDLEELDGIIEMQIKRMWGPRWWLRRLLHRGEKAAASRRATPN